MIELNDWLREELRRHALAERPNECCGLISRAPATDRYPQGRLHLYRAENAAESPTDSFLIAPRDQFAISKTIEISGQTLVGIYHSHPHGLAEPSARDREIARSWPGLVWVIIGQNRCPDCDYPACASCGGEGLVSGFDYFADVLH